MITILPIQITIYAGQSIIFTPRYFLARRLDLDDAEGSDGGTVYPIPKWLTKNGWDFNRILTCRLYDTKTFNFSASLSEARARSQRKSVEKQHRSRVRGSRRKMITAGEKEHPRRESKSKIIEWAYRSARANPQSKLNQSRTFAPKMCEFIRPTPRSNVFLFFAFTHILAHVFARLFLHICVRFLHSNFCVFRTRSSPTHPKKCVFVIFVRFLKKKTFWQQRNISYNLDQMGLEFETKSITDVWWAKRKPTSFFV